MKKKLTDKQQRFIDEYLIDSNATQAAIRSGYSKHTAKVIASKLLTNIDIYARIQERQKELQEETHLTQKWVMQKLEEVVIKSLQEKEVEKWDHSAKCMIGTGEYVYDSKGVNTALNMIGKQIGMFKDRLELSGELVIFDGDDDLED